MAEREVEKLLREIKDYSAQKAIRDLLESGVDSSFLDELVDIFKNGILTRQGKGDLLEQLSKYIKGDGERLGSLQRYVRQVHSDAVTQYVANYSEVLTEDLGLEFYQYVGNVQDDTRCFCRERVNKYFHRKEIEAWGDGRVGVSVDKNCGYPWQGMIAGTNSSNIFTYRGGWNCEHQFVAVLTTSVPKETILRNINNKNYKPSESVKEFFSL